MIERTFNHRDSRVRGTMLLEVVVALALLILGLGVIGVQFKYGNLTAHKNKDLTTAMMLAESKRAELMASTIELEEEQEDDFGEPFPDFSWRLMVEPAEIEGLERYQLEIYQGDPDRLPRLEDCQLVHTSYWLRAARENVNLARDFGLTEEQIAQLGDVMPIEDFDPSDVDPGLLAGIDDESLAEIGSQLIEALGVGDLTGGGAGSEFFTLAAMLRTLTSQAGRDGGAATMGGPSFGDRGGQQPGSGGRGGEAVDGAQPQGRQPDGSFRGYEGGRGEGKTPGRPGLRPRRPGGDRPRFRPPQGRPPKPDRDRPGDRGQGSGGREPDDKQPEQKPGKQ